jgi:uracil-DNA glycosylase family 4
MAWMDRGGEDISSAEAASLLGWWAEAGVDTIVDEEPRDWLRAKPGAPALPAAAPSGPAAEAPPDQLELFRAWLKDSDSLSFASPSARRVCPSGDPASGLMILTDMPTAEDCEANSLLSGEAGRLFEWMLAAIGRDRQSIYLAALSCLRSPDGRFNTEASQQCATLARHHIGLAAPRAVLLFGDACSNALLGMPMTQARGRWHEIPTYAGPVKALVTLSPAHLLNRPRDKAYAWADLKLLMRELAE